MRRVWRPGAAPAAPVGALLAATGAAWFAGTLAPALLYLHRGPLIHLLLAYPGARPARRPAQAVVAAAYVDGAIEPLGASDTLTLLLCAATAAAAVAGYARESGPRRRARVVPTVGALAVALVLALDRADARAASRRCSPHTRSCSSRPPSRCSSTSSAAAGRRVRSPASWSTWASCGSR